MRPGDQGGHNGSTGPLLAVRGPVTKLAGVTRRRVTPPTESRPMELVLSLFPGIDLFGTAFELEGFCVVRGPDLLWGQDVATFRAPAGRFDGIIAGPPCQDFSRARRSAPTGAGVLAIEQFARVVTEARPDWWLMENVEGVPRVEIPGYAVQLLRLTAAECGGAQHRRRVFQWGSSAALPLVVERSAGAGRGAEPCAVASEGTRAGRRGWRDFCALQGLAPGFDLPGWSIAAKYRAVGNGVPLPMGRVLARAVRVRWEHTRACVCGCGCGRTVAGRRILATVACRKRVQRERDAAAGDSTRTCHPRGVTSHRTENR